ncbi:MAG: hypothetical protein NTW53_05480 [Burkholderiales bacterium]|nr:hypothetical protein [Burkholderiales bacterium]
MLADLIVGALAGAITAYVVAIVCLPFAFLFSLGIKREYSLDFWLRSIFLSQLLFWGALILDASATNYGYFKGPEDVIRVAFNFIISIPATALMIRTCMRHRKSKSSVLVDAKDPKDRLDTVFNNLEKAKSAANKLAKAFRK